MKHITIFRFASLLLAFSLLLTLSACGGSGDDPDGTAGSDALAGPVTLSEPVRVMVLSGTTGFGMAPLMDAASKGTSTLKYVFSVENAASVITPALLNGTCDIAALPTNAARTLYAKKPGSIQILCANTLGVLYVMTGEGVTISSFEELRGRTVYCPAQNPTFIFSALCQANGLIPGIDVTIDNGYAQPADLRTALVTGKVDIAVLPEPMVTIAKSANDKLTVSLDLTQEWETAFGADTPLVQGCLVVRTAFAEAHPAAVAAFLAEYEDSVNFVKNNPAEAGAMIEAQGVFTNGAVAAKAIPNCNLCFAAGNDMGKMLDNFYRAMMTFGNDSDSVGDVPPGTAPLYYGTETVE